MAIIVFLFTFTFARRVIETTSMDAQHPAYYTAIQHVKALRLEEKIHSQKELFYLHTLADEIVYPNIHED